MEDALLVRVRDRLGDLEAVANHRLDRQRLGHDIARKVRPGTCSITMKTCSGVSPTSWTVQIYG